MPNVLKISGPIAISALALYKQGLSIKKIAEALGVSRGAVDKFLHKQNLPPNPKHGTEREQEYAKFISDIKNGDVFTNCRKKYNLSYEKAIILLKINNIPLPSRSAAAKERSLTEQEVILRLADPTVTYLGFHEGLYHFKTQDNQLFTKKVSKISQGNPYGKVGKPLSEEEYKLRIAAEGYTLVSKFNTVSKHVTVICKNGHERTAKAERILKQGCPQCVSHGISEQELDLLNWVKGFYPSACKYYLYEPNKKGKRKEIDIYIPELKLGIEYNGLYWHSCPSDSVIGQISNNIKQEEESKSYKKMELAAAEGIRLITIFSSEWLYKKDQVKSFLISAFNKNTDKIAARKCELVEVPTDQAKNFLDKYHIQGGNTSISFCLGLKFGVDIVAVMTGGYHPRRGISNDTALYLTRLAFKTNTTVVGGASKLFKGFCSIANNLEKKEIVSWSDNRWSIGNVYKILGFQLDRPTKTDGKKMGLKDGSIWPEKYATYRGDLISVSKAKSLLKSGVNTNSIRYLWDCGKKKWIYEL